MESKFVVLVHTREDSTVLLNLQELLCGLVFQTLQSRDLEEYITHGTVRTGYHLNIANPLWQSTSVNRSNRPERKEFFRAAFQNDDDLVKENYRSLAGTFHALTRQIQSSMSIGLPHITGLKLEVVPGRRSEL